MTPERLAEWRQRIKPVALDPDDPTDISRPVFGEASITPLLDEIERLTALLRKIMLKGDVTVRNYGPLRPERVNDRFLGLDYSTVDLTSDEADFLAALEPAATEGEGTE